jgi:hypothetical protein
LYLLKPPHHLQKWAEFHDSTQERVEDDEEEEDSDNESDENVSLVAAVADGH